VAGGWDCLKGSIRLLPKQVPVFPVYLFEIDGTLLDSATDICGAIQSAFEGHVPEPVPFDYLKTFIGYHLDVCFRDVLPHYSREQLDEMIQAYRTAYPARGHAGTKLYPGIPEMLRELPGRKGTATTKGTPTTRAILEKFELLPYFDHVQGTDGFPCKPEPDVLLRSIAALGANPKDCLFVGDSAADMEAGRRAGVQTCGVRYGYGNFEDMARWEPDHWISEPGELLALKKKRR
jgi:HAD superfamily hydrolase (TIGR01509 family)